MPGTSLTPGPCDGARILLVDDEAVVRRVTATALRRLGYEVLDASGGEEGVRLAREHAGALDLLLTDLVMSDVPGFEVATAFRAHNPQCPVLFTSGYSDGETRSRIAREGAAFLIKPYDIEGLARAVRETLERARSQGPASRRGER